MRAVRLHEPDRPLQRPDLDDVADLDPVVLAAVDRDERLVRVESPGPARPGAARRRSSGSRTGSRRSASRRGCGCAGRGSGRRPRTSSRSSRWGWRRRARPRRTSRGATRRCVTSSRTTRASDPRATTMSLSAVNASRRGGRPAGRISPGQAPSARGPMNAPALSCSSTRLELVRLGLRQEPDLAQVDAQDRDVDLGDRLGRAEERAVAAEDDEDVGPAQLARPVARSRRPAPPTGPRRASGTSRRRARGSSTRVLDRGVVREADAA